VEDNTAFAAASKRAKDFGVPLLVLFIISIGDYKMHDRSTRKIDFTLRNLRWLKVSPPPRISPRNPSLLDILPLLFLIPTYLYSLLLPTSIPHRFQLGLTLILA
jgi:hypothetical protein